MVNEFLSLTYFLEKDWWMLKIGARDIIGCLQHGNQGNVNESEV